MPLDSSPDYIQTRDNYLRANGINPVADSSALARDLEASGWENWLMVLFPFACEEAFSDDHRAFWNVFWSVLMRIREQKKYILLGLPIPQQFEIKDKEYVILLILGRGLAKSSTIEMSAVMRGALLGGGYCLYVCEAQDQADEHIGNCRGLIESDESRLTEFYPDMAIDTNATYGGMKIKDKADIFMTIGGWICRSKGLNSRLRGLRKGGKRPDDIKIDDIDGVNDSIAVSIKKLKQLTSSVIPTQARRHSTISFGQNLIAENGVMTLIHTGKSDAFAERTTVGVSNTFIRFEEGLDYETYFDEEDGRIKHKILPGAITSWSGVDVAAAQKFLSDSGLETFIAEYQNSFAHQRTDKVFHEFNEARHIIRWSDFERIFGVRYIPPHWKAKATADLGYSKESLSAWLFTAAAAQNSPLPSRYFCYRSLTYCQKSIDDQAVDIWEHLFPDPEVEKRHFEATQSFAAYPELFRLLNTKPRCRDLLTDFVYNSKTNKFDNKPELKLPAHYTPELVAKAYVEEAEKTFRSQIGLWSISHEKTGEQNTLAQKYGIPVSKTKKFGADDGVAEANNLLKGDYTRPHPFFEDEILLGDDGLPSGLYKLGCPHIFFVVDDNQIKAPKDDRGFKTFREQIGSQRWTKEKLGELGLTKTIPMKFQSDCGDSFRMFCADYVMPTSTPLTPIEEFQKRLPSEAIVHPGQLITPEMQMSIQEQHRIAAEEFARDMGLIDDENEEYDYNYDD